MLTLLLLVACDLPQPEPPRDVRQINTEFGTVRAFVDHDAICWGRISTGLSCLPCAQVLEACAATRGKAD